MPYKVEGNKVLHYKNNAWTVKQKCRDHAAAIRAMRLLEAIEHDPSFAQRMRNK